jgi:dihydroxyacetone kinase DhaKLM complex PTS-EIIA-like component DhaM
VKMDSLLNSIISNCGNIDEKLGTSFVSLIRNISCELDEHALT